MPCVNSPWSPRLSPWSAVTIDERLARERREPIEERTERVVRPGNLAGVGIGRIAPGELVWRLVRRVRIEHVHPREPLVRLRSRPGERRRDDGVGAALGEREVHGAAGLADAVVVDVEAGVEAEALIERETADEGAGGKAEALQPRGQRRGPGPDPVAVVVAHAVLVGIRAGQEARMRRQRDDRVRVGEGEPRAARGERFEARRAGAAAVDGNRIRSERVDGDEEHVAVAVGARSRTQPRGWPTRRPPRRQPAPGR